MGKLVVVTGGAGGIGKTVCHHLAEKGYSLAVVDTQARTSDELIADLRQRFGTHGKYEAFPADVRDRESLERIDEQLARDFGPVYGLVTFAGVAQQKPALDISVAEWDEMISVHLTGSFNSSVVFGRSMISQRSGRIILIASMSAVIVNRTAQHCHYNAAKAGIVQLARSLAAEWAAHGITCNSLSPGYVLTPMTESRTLERSEWVRQTPVGRIGVPEDVASAILYILSEESAFLTGQNLIIDGGYTLW